MGVDRKRAEARYSALRQLAYGHALAGDELAGQVTLEPIRRHALEHFAAAWADHPRRRVSWPWPVMVADYQRNHPERFEVALWSGDTLCGLALGRPSRSKSVLTVKYVEGNPDLEHPLKGLVAAIAIATAHAYAKALGSTLLRLDAPLEPLVPLYRDDFGFTLVLEGTRVAYCEMEIAP